MNKLALKIKVLIGLVILIIIMVGVAFLFRNKEVYMSEEEISNIFENISNSVTMGELIKEETPLEDMTFGSNDYYDFMSTPLNKVNFNSLKKRNSDTVGWLKVNGTNINYPVVQSVNNTYYLTRSFTKGNNASGWVFMDFRNDINNLQDNTIIYAHGQTKDTMFSTLKNIYTSTWQQNPENHTITILTATETQTWQVFSVYRIPTELYYLISTFGKDSEHQKFIDTMLKRSLYNFNTPVTINDKMLTLSTCLNDEIKVVLHAKLVEKKAR